MIHYVGKGEMELRDQDSGRNHNFSFKAITVERTNSLDIHKVSQRLTQYRLSTQKNNKNILDIHTPPPHPPLQEKINFTTHSLQKTPDSVRWLQLLRLIGAKAARETGHKVVLIDRVGGASASLGCRGSERTFDRVCVCVCVCV